MNLLPTGLQSVLPALLILLLACRQQRTQSEDISNTADTLRPKEIFIKKGDSIVTKGGNYYKFIFLDSTNNYKIKWGNKDQSLISKEIFKFGSGGLLLTESLDNAILLTKSCGTSCREGVILTINETLNIKHYVLLKSCDLKQELVAYTPADGDTLIKIENFNTGKFVSLSNVSLCPAAFQGDCIDSLGFSGDKFYIQWQGSKWRRQKKDTQERYINIAGLIVK